MLVLIIIVFFTMMLSSSGVAVWYFYIYKPQNQAIVSMGTYPSDPSPSQEEDEDDEDDEDEEDDEDKEDDSPSPSSGKYSFSAWKEATTKQYKGKPKTIDAFIKAIEDAKKNKKASYKRKYYPYAIPAKDFDPAIQHLKKLKSTRDKFKFGEWKKITKQWIKTNPKNKPVYITRIQNAKKAGKESIKNNHYKYDLPKKYYDKAIAFVNSIKV